tara:strand:+ start:11 stop:217 length:207 start_codon:yes stop_codon:yes gene_type:complete
VIVKKKGYKIMINKPIQKSLEVLKKEMLLSILSVKGVIYTNYKNKFFHRDTESSLETFLGTRGHTEKQ